MNETEATNRGGRGRTALAVLILLGVAANLLLTLALHREMTMLGQAGSKWPHLPCAAIPTRFVAQEPVCAQKLIEAMNVTNVRVFENESPLQETSRRAGLPQENELVK